MSRYKVIYIDAGHGNHDPGAVGVYQGRKLNEKDLNLGVALELQKLFKDGKFIVSMSREGDSFMTPGERARDANNKRCDLFISIHHNAAGSNKATGTETLHYPNSKEGMLVAKAVNDQLVKTLDLQDRGLKPRDNLSVIRLTKMTAILVEVLFVSNPNDLKKAVGKNYYKDVAKAIYDGVISIND